MKGAPKGILQKGERKNLQTDRVIIVPGPEEEIKVVNCIYDMFIDEKKLEIQIARILNARGIKPDNHHCWTWAKVHAILTDEKYIGNYVYDRRSVKLKGKNLRNPPEKWIRVEGVFQGIVDRKRFEQAQKVIQERQRKYEPEEMLFRLRQLFLQHGYITHNLINQADDLPRAGYFIHRFGNLNAAYHAVGFKARWRSSHTPVWRRLMAATQELGASLARQVQNAGGSACWQEKGHMLHLNDEL